MAAVQGGDVQLAALCVSEADAGSDLSSMETRAMYDGTSDTWTLNGTIPCTKILEDLKDQVKRGILASRS
jgi:alkylation response protein AidB-like acyl-CoA dehydrogenase